MIYIILPTYNRKETTKILLNCLKNQIYQDFKILLIDSGSTDGTQEMAKDFFNDLFLIQGKPNWWWAKCLHEGYDFLKKRKESFSEQDIVLILNDDTILEKDFLLKGYNYLTNTSKTIITAQCKDLNDNIIDTGVNIEWTHLNFSQAQENENINCLSTRGMFMHINEFLSLKGFFQKLLPHYFSDYEFTIRAYKKGFNLVTDKNIYLKVNTETTGIRKLRQGNIIFVLKQMFSMKYVNNPIHYISFILLSAPLKLKTYLCTLIVKDTIKKIKKYTNRKISKDEIIKIKSKYPKAFEDYKNFIESSKLNIAIYGLNDFGLLIYETFKPRVKYIIDENKAGGFLDNIKIIKLEELKDHNILIVICAIDSKYLIDIHKKFKKLNFTNYIDRINIINQTNLKLYAGDIHERDIFYNGYLGLSLTQENKNHIKWDLSHLPLPFKSNSVDIFQSEDVFEHIELDLLPDIINEIYRILKPHSLFRLSMPDYNCDILYKRSIYNFDEEIVFDPLGGGTFENPSHVWFPTYKIVKKFLEKTKFHSNGKIDFLHYWIDKNNFITKPIDYSKGYIARTPDHDERVKMPYRPMSIVVDLYKG